jgi:hypothetical protein
MHKGEKKFQFFLPRKLLKLFYSRSLARLLSRENLTRELVNKGKRIGIKQEFMQFATHLRVHFMRDYTFEKKKKVEQQQQQQRESRLFLFLLIFALALPCARALCRTLYRAFIENGRRRRHTKGGVK